MSSQTKQFSSIKQEAEYEDLCNIPDNMIGQIIDGEIIALPRPSYQHSIVSSSITGEIWGHYQMGRHGGPGGWWILYEPDIKFGKNIFVPDLAGWKKERMPKPPELNYSEIPPDWICEVLSPGSIRIDRIKKMNKYAQFGVLHIWLIDPIAKTFEVFRLESQRWVLILSGCEDDKVRAEPFQEIEIDLKNLWWE